MPELTPKNRYIIAFEFYGRNFYGSQKQPDKRTVQGEIEKALCTLTKNKVNITISGRTDAKVSARYQTAHFDIETPCLNQNNPINDKDKFLYSLNCILPDDVKIFKLEKVLNSFHAQKDAKYKHYRYKILNSHVASVFSDDYLFYPYIDLNIDRINNSLQYLIGHHDFSAFKSQSDNPYNDCTIYYAAAKKEKIGRNNFVFIDIVGNRFLYNMVRTITGEVLFIERNNLNPDAMQKVLISKDRTKAASVIDAKGLTLEYVGYDDVESYINKQLKGR